MVWFCLILSYTIKALKNLIEFSQPSIQSIPLHLIKLNLSQTRKFQNEWIDHPNKIINNHLAPVRYIKSNKMTIVQKKQITLITFNINGSFLNQQGPNNPINLILQDKKPDILGIIDTRHSNDLSIPSFNTYNFFQIEKFTENSGGIIVYYKLNLNPQIQVLTLHKYRRIQIDLIKNKIQFHIVYFPVFKSSNFELILQCWRNLFLEISKVKNLNYHIILQGDFNFNTKHKKTNKKIYKDISKLIKLHDFHKLNWQNECSLKNLCNFGKYTFIKKGPKNTFLKSILDYTLIHKLSNIQKATTIRIHDYKGKSDHTPIMINFPLTLEILDMEIPKTKYVINKENFPYATRLIYLNENNILKNINKLKTITTYYNTNAQLIKDYLTKTVQLILLKTNVYTVIKTNNIENIIHQNQKVDISLLKDLHKIENKLLTNNTSANQKIRTNILNQIEEKRILQERNKLLTNTLSLQKLVMNK